MSPEQKSESFLLRMGPTELRMLQELSDRSGLTKADVVRQLIRKEHAEVSPGGKSKTWLIKAPKPRSKK
jgi:hypothetical protein